ncbi:MAG: dienelactone hydrolase family protein [Hyphomicrobiaceae bacterium]|nr:dienelactone hydrolase family protein [Hyphomicrobiaceae bacterium]
MKALVAAAGIGLVAAVLSGTGAAQDAPERVTFASADGKTTLVGYVFTPAASNGARRHPGVVMMHGRAGAYSERARTYDAATLSLRHAAWGQEWARAGYVAIPVDGFGPRGYPGGFPRGSYASRPAEHSEIAVRPLDAYGALAYLRTRADVDGAHVGLHGWSNGASATLVAISDAAPGIETPSTATGFRAALAFYPACGLQGLFADRPLAPYAPTLVLHGTADEEVSAERCRRLVETARAAGGNIQIRVYEGATHSFDAPSRKRQRIAANAQAREDAVPRALAFFALHVKAH